MKNVYKIFIICTMLLFLLVACGKTEEKTDNEMNKNEYIDMSAYKGIYGYVVENNTFDYRDVFDITYDWGNDVHMPFPKPDGKVAEFNKDNGSYALKNITEDEADIYIMDMEKYGYKTCIYHYDGYARYIIYKDEIHCVFTLVEDDKRMYMYVDTGFVKNPILDNEEVHKLIDEKGVLKDKAGFEEYYVISMENETVRKAGYYEGIVLSKDYFENPVDSLKPYDMLSDGKEIYLFEQGLYDSRFPCVADIIEDKGEKWFIASTTTYDVLKGESGDRTIITQYILKDNEFVFENMEVFPADLEPLGSENNRFYIGRYTDGKYVVYPIEERDNFDIRKGYKECYILNKEEETNIIELK